jgi:hypothetical protein
MGSRLPPAVTACPRPDSNSFSVVETISVTGNPLWLPNWPDASIARANALSGIELRHRSARPVPGIGL